MTPSPPLLVSIDPSHPETLQQQIYDAIARCGSTEPSDSTRSCNVAV